jgi:cysteinyl-tRNA synthetase
VRQLRALGAVLGLLQRDAQVFLQSTPAQSATDAAAGETRGYSNEEIDQLVQERVAARKGRNFAEADRLRKLLSDAGIALEDSAQGTSWRRA